VDADDCHLNNKRALRILTKGLFNLLASGEEAKIDKSCRGNA